MIGVGFSSKSKKGANEPNVTIANANLIMKRN